jgi:hypothetical protein
MELKELNRHLLTLATLRQADAPVISCYLNLESAESGYRRSFDERVRLLRRTLEAEARWHFEDALGRIEVYLRDEILPGTAGVAMFARGGEQPFFLPLQFSVPLPNWFVVDAAPNIYHLVELKDTYDRYVVVLCTEAEARVLGLNLGGVVEEVWKRFPDLQDRAGREWTREHYRYRRRQQTNQFISELIRVVSHLTSAGGYAHLILAGNPRIVSQIRNTLPSHLAAKVIDVVPASEYDRTKDVIAATLISFVEQEERESQGVVERLQKEISTDGLAVVGTHASFEALRWGQVDVLVVARDYQPSIGWACRECDAAAVDRSTTMNCSECGSTRIRKFDIKEEMVRMAEANGSAIEVVNESDVLLRVGGVGCLLRFVGLERYGLKAA